VSQTGSTANPSGMAVTYTFAASSTVPAYLGGGIEIISTNYRRFPVVTQAAGNVAWITWGVAVRTSSARVAFSVGAGEYRFKVRTPGGEERYVSLTPEVTTGNTFIVLDFASSADRIVTIEAQDNRTFRAVNVDTGQTATNPGDADGITLIFGDSFTVGNPGPTTKHDGVATCLGELLGLRNVWACGIGGTGYVADNSATRYKLYDHIAADVARAVAIAPVTKVFVLMGVNDKGLSGVQAEATACFDLLRSLLPAASISVASPWDTDAPSAASANFEAVTTAIQAAALGRGGVHFLDLESVAFTPVSGIHPGDAGALVLAQALATAERAAVSA